MSQGATAHALDALCTRLDIDVPPAWSSYADAVKRWGARTDLTSAKNDTELCEILFLDAAALIREGWSTGEMVDVGAGVGAPTLPLLLANVAKKAVLVEPRRKRVVFLRSAIGETGLESRAEVREGKVDPRAPELAGAPFDTALSRATFDPETWRRLGARLAREVLVFTAGSEPEELPAFECVRSLRYEVPSTGAPRAIFGYRRLA